MTTQAKLSLVQGGAAPGNFAEVLDSLVRADGTAAHAYPSSKLASPGRHAARNLADAVHFLSSLHGRHPGVVDDAGLHTALPGAGEWLVASADGFLGERRYLTRLVVAAGPLPSTPGQAESEAAMSAQRHAIEMLAKSDRAGCALGAAMALVIDWHGVRGVLDAAAARLGVEVEACALPPVDATRAVALRVADTPAIERAMLFGAQQLLGQHKGLWDLLEARQIARGEF